MGKVIDTMVYGSPNTCEAAADWLDRFSEAMGEAGDTMHDGESQLDLAWFGPAFDAFSDSQHGAGNGLDDLSDSGSSWSGVLRDFASGLRGVQQKMDEILDQARKGDLEVQGPFILQPVFNLKAPQKPATTPADPDDNSPAAQAYKNYQLQVWGYNQGVDQFNTKAELFNDLQEQAFDQRKTEKDLHQELDQGMVLSNGIDVINFALTGVSWGNTFVSSTDGVYQDEMKAFNELKKSGNALDDFANGRVSSDADMSRVGEVMTKQNAQAARTQVASQWRKLIKWVPDPMVKASGAGPDSIPKLPASAAKGLKGFTYLGAVIAAGSEFSKAARGQESYAKAGVNTGRGVVEGTLVSRAMGGAMREAGAGPTGILAGSVTGALGASQVHKNFADYVQEKGEEQKDWKRYYQPVNERDHIDE